MTAQSIYKSPTGQQAIHTFYDRVLESWPIPYDLRIVPTRHGDTSVIVSGNGDKPPIILLHGSASNAITWAGDVETYTRDYTVYAVDILGEPGKSAPNRLPYEGAAFDEWLEDVRTGLNLSKVTLVGLSFGGWVATRYALTYAQHVEAVVLLNPGGVVPHRPGGLLQLVSLSFFGTWGMNRSMRLLFADEPIPEGTTEAMMVISKHFRPRSAPPVFTDAELGSLTIPVLLIVGEKDCLFDAQAAASRVNTLIAHSEVQVVPGAGHAIVYTAQQVLDGLVKLNAQPANERHIPQRIR
jgi:pimeloyl-ACP methyl ester carboxylesterase